MAKTLVLLTNDDGIDAPGLKALELELNHRDDVEVWTFAPDGQRSTCSHAMTLHRPLFCRQVGDRRFAVSGFTADCVYFGMFGRLDKRPDVVISGVNQGPNLGWDVIYSGTVAGAREAVIRGVHGVSASLISGGDFARAAASTACAALELLSSGVEKPRLLNLNFPAGDFNGIELGRLGVRHYPEKTTSRTAPLTGEEYFWLGGPPVRDALIEGTDGWLVSRGTASATYLTVDQTDRDSENNFSLPFTGGSRRFDDDAEK